MVRSRLMAVGVAGVLAAMGALAQQPSDPAAPPTIERLASDFDGELTLTWPSEDAEISFQITTQVMEVLVGVGEEIAEGGLLIQGDDAEERALLEIQRERAQTDIPIRRAREQHELAKVELARLEKAGAGGGANEQELERARVSAVIAGIDVEQAQFTAAQEKISLRRVEERVKKFALRAPFDCRVVSVEVDAGDTVREGEPVIRVVKIDPLHIDVDAPLAQAFMLNVGDPAWALIGVPGAPVVVQGRVMGISPVADFAARSQRVRVEIANPQGLPAGLPVWVRFSEPSAPFQELMAGAGGEGGLGGGLDDGERAERADG